MDTRPHLTEVTPIEEGQPRKSPRSRIWGMLDQLRKRKVCRTAISYMLVMWLNLQIGDVIFPMIGLPDWSLSLVIVVGVMGFPVVLILAWAFQVTPQGIVLDQGEDSDTHTEWKLDAFVNLLLLASSIALSVLLLRQYFVEERAPLVTSAPVAASTGMVVSNLSFEAATEEPVSRAMALRIREELRHRLINLQGIDLLPDEMMLNPNDDRRRLSLAGNLLLEGGKAHVLAYLIDLSAGRYLMSMTFNMNVETVFGAEATTADRIVNEVRKALRGDQTVVASARGA